MDTELCRAHLEQLMQAESQTLKQLSALLQAEHQFITQDDLESLDNAGREREACVQQLMRIDAERQALCRTTGYSSDKDGLLALLTWCDARGTLIQHWQQSLDAIRHCRDLNDRNGALVNNRMKRVEVMLDSINGNQGRDSRTYTARGNAYAQSNAGRVCSIQA